MLYTQGNFKQLVASLLGVMDSLVPVLIALALVFFLIGGVKFIWSEGAEKNRSLMLWSLVALFVMISVWGIVRLLENTLLGDSRALGTGDPTSLSAPTKSGPGAPMPIDANFYKPRSTGESFGPIY